MDSSAIDQRYFDDFPELDGFQLVWPLATCHSMMMISYYIFAQAIIIIIIAFTMAILNRNLQSKREKTTTTTTSNGSFKGSAIKKQGARYIG